MAYWWVFQGDSFGRSRRGNYLWAPKLDKKGQGRAYWNSMAQVEPGDVIFSGYHQRLVALSTASGRAYDAGPPDPRDLLKWPGGAGWRLDVSYVDLPTALPYRDFVPQVLHLLPDRYAPFNRQTGKGNLGYLFPLPDAAGEILLRKAEMHDPSLVENAIEAELEFAEIQDTSKQAIIEARRGQGVFRDNLDWYWGGRCAVAGIAHRELLRASHIKPWANSNHRERLDSFNGLLLSVSYDAAFDALLLTFKDDGVVALSPDLDRETAAALGINPDGRLSKIDDRHRNYLADHRRRFEERLRRLAHPDDDRIVSLSGLTPSTVTGC